MRSNIPVFVGFAFTTVLLCIAMVTHLEVSEISNLCTYVAKLELMEKIKSNERIYLVRDESGKGGRTRKKKQRK